MYKSHKILIQSIAAVTLLGAFFFALQLFAFTEPTVAPPGGNVSAPLNISSSLQTKVGALIVNTGAATYGFSVAAGNVGIGTLAPQGRLHVLNGLDNFVGPVRLGDAYGVWLRYEGWEPDKVFGLGIQGSTGNLGFWVESLTGGAALSTLTPASPELVITPGGNVGIGDATPSQKLDVAGQIHATGDICTDAGGGKCLSGGAGGASSLGNWNDPSGKGGTLGGAATTYAINTQYGAVTSNGFVVASAAVTGGNYGFNQWLKIGTCGALVTYQVSGPNSDGAQVAFMSPVKKGQCWEIVSPTGAGAIIHWIPLP